MPRKTIQIDSGKCIGCGLCVNACQQGVIEIIDGKAQVVRDDYCDGLGNCLPVCPVEAIQFSEGDAAAPPTPQAEPGKPVAFACPGMQTKRIERPQQSAAVSAERPPSELNQWPVQIKLAPVRAPYFHHADLLIAADCTAYAYAAFHQQFMRNRITLIGCPKLDMTDYTEKLSAIMTENDIKSVTIVRMEVPCCAGIEQAAVQALKNSGKFLPWQVVTLSTDGRIL